MSCDCDRRCCKNKKSILECLDEVEDFLCRQRQCKRPDNCGPRYDFRWRFSAAMNNICMKVKGGRRG